MEGKEGLGRWGGGDFRSEKSHLDDTGTSERALIYFLCNREL